ncbi:DUF2442 domain-containing protein [Oscillatoria amoena NRMC-F 0135]|nr:DUF2442 domain-containing protein [Oscillatoria amoena NRMC-F 0135]
MNPRILKATPEDQYRIYLEFSNGERREFDVTPYLEKGIFRKLKDETYFRQVRVSMGTIEWPEGQDFCPDTIYEMSKVIA